MALSNGYVTLRQCHVECEPPGMATKVACSLELGHSGLHYWASEFADMHVALSWHAPTRGPAPVSARAREEEGSPLLVSPYEVGTHTPGAGS